MDVMFDNSLINRFQSESVTIQDFIIHWNEAFEKKYHDRDKKIYLFNYQTTGLCFTQNDIESFGEFLFSKRILLNNQRIGIITKDPKTTCFFLLIQNKIYSKINCELKVFSTEIAAIHWAQ